MVSATSVRNGAGFMPCQGLYHTPAGTNPKVAFIATHYNVDFSEHYLAPYLAERGYGYLGWNTRFRGNEAFLVLEHALVDIAAGVRWLYESAGVEQVVIVGNSGGGSLMGAYQSQATEPNIAATRGLRLPEAVFDLPSCDYYVSLNAHAGRPDVLTAWFDPAITDETDPASTDWSLSMFNPENGPPYSPEFVDRYRTAQFARNERLTDWCIGELARLDAAGMSDRAFNMYRTWADLRLLDGTLDPSDRPVGVCYAGDPRRANYSPRGIGLTSTCRSWLSMWSLRESHCRGEPHLRRIDVPSLVVQSTSDTGVFPSDAHAIHDALGSHDKSLEFMAGDHYLTEPDGARDEVADRISGWLDGYGI
ncbi:MAG: alpha/beta hydrolase [Actinomycetia bacterium]|nr:alpha/beta hydrolase [Actinomycetes bacterium]MCP4957743.1 alpha/beta hydrolase [Actinomycetes bacterium]